MGPVPELDRRVGVVTRGVRVRSMLTAQRAQERGIADDEIEGPAAILERQGIGVDQVGRVTEMAASARERGGVDIHSDEFHRAPPDPVTAHEFVAHRGEEPTVATGRVEDAHRTDPIESGCGECIDERARGVPGPEATAIKVRRHEDPVPQIRPPPET